MRRSVASHLYPHLLEIRRQRFDRSQRRLAEFIELRRKHRACDGEWRTESIERDQPGDQSMRGEIVAQREHDNTCLCFNRDVDRWIVERIDPEIVTSRQCDQSAST